jgi:hypothetical protein
LNIQAILTDISAHWHVYITMPFIAALIGYLTKRVAIEMMFRPLEFVGIKPFLGWQGVIPANARRMATTAVELLTKEPRRPTGDLLAARPGKSGRGARAAAA